MSTQKRGPATVIAATGRGKVRYPQGSPSPSLRQYRGLIRVLRWCDACSRLPVLRGLAARLAGRVLRRITSEQRLQQARRWQA